MDLENFNEILVCEIKLNNHKLFYVSFYRAPNSDMSFNNNLHLVLERIQSKSPNTNICLIGDLNLPQINWDTFKGNSLISDSFCDTTVHFNLQNINQLPSRVINNNILDVVVTNFPDSFSEIHHRDPAFTSDHHMIEFDILLQKNIKQDNKRWTFNFKKVNFDELNFRIKELDLITEITSHEHNIDLAWDMWLHSIQSFMNIHIPKTQIKSKTSPWIDGERLHHIHLKKRAWKKAKNSNTPHD